MSVIPDKKDYKKVEKRHVEAFIPELVRRGYQLASHVLPNEKSHFDRFGFVKNDRRTVVVYDVKANMLSITALGEQFAEVCSVFEKLNGGSDAMQSTTGAETVGQNRSKKPTKKPNEKKQSKTSVEQSIVADFSSPSLSSESADRSAEVSKGSNRRTKRSDRIKNTGGAVSLVKERKNVNVKTQTEVEKITGGEISAKTAVNSQKAEKKAAVSKKTEQPRTKANNISDGKTEQKLSASESLDAKQTDKSNASKNDFTLKKYTDERFNAAVELLKEGKIKIKLKSKQGRGALSVDVYEVSGDGSKLTVSYMPEKKVLQIQGKANDFSRKVQTLFSESLDYKSAVKAHIEQKNTDERAGDVEKRLKKYLPVGCIYLSAQAKIDFSIGIVDLLSGNIVLSDYSSLLIPPYRGLEKLIFDLEQGQGIKVKMIGQAYEKNEKGDYILKSIYRKRIGSVVFAEVMAALYTEYNSTRNFYVHSASGHQTKVINDKNQAISIYENMLSVVEYNAKKLREIGFSLKN